MSREPDSRSNCFQLPAYLYSWTLKTPIIYRLHSEKKAEKNNGEFNNIYNKCINIDVYWIPNRLVPIFELNFCLSQRYFKVQQWRHFSIIWLPMGVFEGVSIPFCILIVNHVASKIRWHRNTRSVILNIDLTNDVDVSLHFNAIP